jgi:hypothetical protein
MMLGHYLPKGVLGLGLTALMASFMSGMAGNVTAFNTVWTYDIYQAYIAPNKSDAHYMTMGRIITVVGILLSIACSYVASNYNNAMDIIQLVFGFVNAPLFATFVLGMFWARTTSHGAFFGLLAGTGASALFHATTLAVGNAPGIKGGYLGVLAVFPSEMAQNFWLATVAFGVCFFLTLFISLATKRTKSDEELKGLVYSLTPKPASGGSNPPMENPSSPSGPTMSNRPTGSLRTMRSLSRRPMDRISSCRMATFATDHRPPQSGRSTSPRVSKTGGSTRSASTIRFTTPSIRRASPTMSSSWTSRRRGDGTCRDPNC